jgi:flagellar protein FlgJ
MIAAPQLSDRLALDVQSAQALRAGARAGDPEALRSAAKQFEAMVVQMMLKNMRQTSFAQEGDVMGESNSLKLYREMLDQQWAQKMVAGKGFGFAEMMVKAMESRNKAASPDQMAMLAQPEETEGHAREIPEKAPRHILPERRSDAALRAPGIQTHASPVAQVAIAAMPPVATKGAIEVSDLPEPAQAPGEAPRAGFAAGGYREQFVARLQPHAEQVEEETGIPARFILAHAALETGWGRHEIRKADGSPSHNLFGIKAGRGWQGEVAQQETTEYQYGLPVRRQEPFRAYGSYTEAFRDYASLLARRYQNAVQAGEDAVAFAHGLAGGGYATDPNYAGKLKGVIASLSGLGT